MVSILACPNHDWSPTRGFFFEISTRDHQAHLCFGIQQTPRQLLRSQAWRWSTRHRICWKRQKIAADRRGSSLRFSQELHYTAILLHHRPHYCHTVWSTLTSTSDNLHADLCARIFPSSASCGNQKCTYVLHNPARAPFGVGNTASNLQ